MRHSGAPLLEDSLRGSSCGGGAGRPRGPAQACLGGWQRLEIQVCGASTREG
jgi:hypothetical protein